MRREVRRQLSMLMVVNLEQRIPNTHLLRQITQMANAAWEELSPRFERWTAVWGGRRFRPSSCAKARC